MHCTASPNEQFHRQICAVWAGALLLGCVTGSVSPPVEAQDNSLEETEAVNNSTDSADNLQPFKQARYSGNAILIHLPTNKARALIMPEPVVLQGNPEQMPGVELAYEGDVIGFFATRNFTRRTVSFVGTESGTEYQLQIRASERGIVEPLEIVR